MEIPQAVTDARSEAAKLGNIASDYAASEFTIPDQLRKTVQEALDYNKDVVGMRSKGLADYIAAPAQANAKFGVQQFGSGPQAGQANPDFIFNPFERNSAIISYIANQSIPFSFANTLLGMREGTAADTINAGTRAFQSQSTAAQAAAAAARQTYQDVLNEFVTKTQLDQEQQRINISGRNSGGSDFSALLPFLQTLLGDKQGGDGGTPDLSMAVEDDDPLDAINSLPANLKFVGPNLNSVVSQASASMRPASKQALPSVNIKGGKSNYDPKSPISKIPLAF